ncbi:DUF7167 family protein [Nonomuraea basaltis]|uniref:DUF7167 family protein n=1 Tax=Nonomuraea basaltis TaxID=2495887 RepID=UPI00110C6B34|nr:hypothetical protein [Nonomuraea basaltis]TMS00145.1 hypothetical protein EJK15_03475 [Nonomuraea basaltis]
MSDGETIQLKVDLSIGLANAKQEDVIDSGILKADWDAMTAEKRDEAAREVWEEWAWEYIEGGWDVVEE